MLCTEHKGSLKNSFGMRWILQGTSVFDGSAVRLVWFSLWRFIVTPLKKSLAQATRKTMHAASTTMTLIPLVVMCLFYVVVNVATTLPLKGSSHGIDPNRTIEAVEGEKVTFQHSLDSEESLVNLTVDWKRDGSVVYAYQYGREQRNYQAAEYRGRTSLDHEDLHSGVVTFHLSNVQLSDSGVYCVFISERTVRFCDELHVEKKQQQRQESSTAGQESSSVGPLVEDATRAGVARNHAAAIAAAAAAAAAFICLLVMSRIIQYCRAKKTHLSRKPS